MESQEVIDFWLQQTTPKQRFSKDKAFDQAVAQRFASCLLAAARGELYAWRKTALGRLAEIIVLDQFSRNIHRDQAAAFAHDAQALCLAQEAIHTGAATELNALQRSFLYMPFMHSESLLIHEQAMRLFAEAGLEDNLDFERRHYAIIQRFGRYPHRNAVLGRESTPEEEAFLLEAGSGF